MQATEQLTSQTSTDRQYYIDWLRILLILSVFLFHVGMIFNTWDWHIKNDVQYAGFLRKTMIFLHYWRMPLLFLISGAGTYFALGRRNTLQYIGERFKRLVVPLAAGIFILVPVQVYIEKSADFQSLFHFYPHMFEGTYPEGNFSWHHLWFIAYLFIISMVISPLIMFFRSTHFTNFSAWLARVVSKPLMLNIFMIPMLVSQAILRPLFPESTHGLVDDWAYFTMYAIFFLAGYLLLSNRDIVNTLRKHRFWYLGEGIIATAFMFKVPYMMATEQATNLTWDIAALFVSWSCSMAALGFAKQHLNLNNKLRKPANQAIYPFYLLHQPALVVVGSLVVQWQIPDIFKALIITFSCFLISILIYQVVIKPFNPIRAIFGMKPNVKELNRPFNWLKGLSGKKPWNNSQQPAMQQKGSSTINLIDSNK